MRTTGWKFPLGLVGIAAAVFALYYYFLGLAPVLVEPASQPASMPAAPQIIVKAVSGEAVRKDAAGKQEALRVGATLVASDEVRTDPGASAVLTTTDDGEIRLGEGAAVGIGGDDFFLLQGAIEAVSGKAPLRIGASGTSGRIQVDGVARLLADGIGGVVVGDISGTTKLQNAGATVVLQPGQASRLSGNVAPEAAWKIPPSLLLKVRWPSDTELATKKLHVTGQASQGSLVTVRGKRVLVDGSGHFAADISLDEGINLVQLGAEDAAGHTSKSEVKVSVDTTPADVGVDTNPEMWKKH